MNSIAQVSQQYNIYVDTIANVQATNRHLKTNAARDYVVEAIKS